METCFSCAVDRIHPMDGQPRENFNEDALRELAQSLREHGLVEPLVVRPRGDDFELIAGERRLRAAKLAGLTEVLVVTREATDREALEVALVENIQREDLNDIEFAKALRRLQQDYGYTNQALALKLGKDNSTIANTLRLLNLPEEVQHLIVDGEITAGHGRALLGIADNPVALAAAVERVLAERLGVRATEQLARRHRGADGSSVTSYEAAVQGITHMARHAAAIGVDMYEELEYIERSGAWRDGRHANFGEFLSKNWPNSLGLHRYSSVVGAIGVYGVDLIRAVGAEAAHCLLDPTVVESDEKRAAVVNDLKHHIKKHGAAPQLAEIRRLVRHHAGEVQRSDVADRAAAARERDVEMTRLRQEIGEAERKIKSLTKEVDKLQAENATLLSRNTDLSKQLSQTKR